MLVPAIQNEIVRNLVRQMYSYYTKPDKAVVTDVAKKLVQKNPFMRDDGPKVSTTRTAFDKMVAIRRDIFSPIYNIIFMDNDRPTIGDKMLRWQTSLDTMAKTP